MRSYDKQHMDELEYYGSFADVESDVAERPRAFLGDAQLVRQEVRVLRKAVDEARMAPPTEALSELIGWVESVIRELDKI